MLRKQHFVHLSLHALMDLADQLQKHRKNEDSYAEMSYLRKDQLGS